MADCATNFTLSCVNGGAAAGANAGGVVGGGAAVGGAGGVTGLPGAGVLTTDTSQGGSGGELPVRPRVSSF
jgi:hypothetical protein